MRQGRVSLWAGLMVSAAIVPLWAQSAKPRFEVASIKEYGPGSLSPSPPTGSPAPAATTSFRRGNVTLASLVQYAYGITRWQLVDGPTWVREERFEIEARAAKPASPDEMRVMVQSLLAERFELALRQDRRDMQFFALEVTRSDGQLGPQLTKCDPTSPRRRVPVQVAPDGVALNQACVPMSSIVTVATTVLGAPVDDRTGLVGVWNYQLAYSDNPQASSSTPTFVSALQEQLGLKVTASRGPVDVLVIEKANRPSPN